MMYVTLIKKTVFILVFGISWADHSLNKHFGAGLYDVQNNGPEELLQGENTSIGNLVFIILSGLSVKKKQKLCKKNYSEGCRN